MTSAVILLNVKRSKVNEVAGLLAEIKGVREAYSVSGKYDIVAIVRVPTNDDLVHLVTDKLNSIDSIMKTETMLAFKAYHGHDLEAMFDVGN